MRDLVWKEYCLKLSSRTQIMGIINLTPDSFSGDGMYNLKSLDRVIRVAERMVEDGADIIDVGGESTRPDSKPVSVQEEIKRVIPTIARLANHIKIPISIDTYKTEVAKAALDAGASMVNSIKGIKRNIRLAK
ncbi:dihydropteroate synthase, partial [candidate division WOR-3 bacterium]|nr:dihydropteroate synthase [candidate division WOR-3 bacterium]